MSTATETKWVYRFADGNAEMRDLLGGKGAGLSEMTNAQLPVPPGFTITTEACNAYNAAGKQFPAALWDQTLAAMQEVEVATGKRFGDPQNPLLVSVRSGAKFSMPGMMDTVLNLGLNSETLQGLAELTGNGRFANDAYRRFIQMFGKIVMGVPGEHFEELLDEVKQEVDATQDTDLTADQLMDVVERFKALVREEAGQDFPDDPYEQLRQAIEAVFASWDNPRAHAYRDFHKLPHDLGTAVNIVTMVFGNMGGDSGTGVAFTRDPATGEQRLFGEFLTNAQGEDVVAGIRTPRPIAQLARDMPGVYREFEAIAERLEQHYRDTQDLEFTIERGTLYMLQTRSAKRTAAAAVKIAVDMAQEGLISREEAIQRVEPDQIYQLLLPHFDEEAKAEASSAGRWLTTGLNASPGAATGKAVFDADRAAELGGAGEAVILVRPETNPDDVHGMLVAQGILTARGGATSHAAVVARGLGKSCVAGAESILVDTERRQFTVNGQVVREDDAISIDGTTGEVFTGVIPTVETHLEDERELQVLLSWADEHRQLGVWANADYPRDAQRALRFGAEGIGLCRTEHMFFEEDRLPIVQQMILAAGEATALENELAQRQAALAAAEGRRARVAARRQVAEQEAAVASSSAVKDYREALDRLQEVQAEDFRGVLGTMAGRPVIIRLLDPPLHEFLPNYEELRVQLLELTHRGVSPADRDETEYLLQAVGQMTEANPMLGMRGCRLGLLYPAIYAMQVRAILGAASDLAQNGVDIRPEIMIPLVGHVNELKMVRDQLEEVAAEIERETGQDLHYKFGTMIELPRAALTADEIAEHAEFFSYGTNDLTQTTFGYSRDDAESKFLMPYMEQGVLPENPFQTLDRNGVGKLIKMGVELGRSTRPELEIGICGEHGGDPASVTYCHEIGLDYVSCSPFRVPVARLAAAQAALAHSGPRDV